MIGKEITIFTVILASIFVIEFIDQVTCGQLEFKFFDALTAAGTVGAVAIATYSRYADKRDRATRIRTNLLAEILFNLHRLGRMGLEKRFLELHKEQYDNLLANMWILRSHPSVDKLLQLDKLYMSLDQFNTRLKDLQVRENWPWINLRKDVIENMLVILKMSNYKVDPEKVREILNSIIETKENSDPSEYCVNSNFDGPVKDLLDSVSNLVVTKIDDYMNMVKDIEESKKLERADKILERFIKDLESIYSTNSNSINRQLKVYFGDLL